MENKMTAMQTLMEWMIEESQVIPVDAEETYNKAKELLAMEQKQIIDAHEEGWNDSMQGIHRNATYGKGYYNETYGK